MKILYYSILIYLLYLIIVWTSLNVWKPLSRQKNDYFRIKLTAGTIAMSIGIPLLFAPIISRAFISFDYSDLISPPPMTLHSIIIICLGGLVASLPMSFLISRYILPEKYVLWLLPIVGSLFGLIYLLFNYI